MNRHSISIALLGILGSSTAQAAAGPAEEAWGIAFWVFIGYCSLVVIPQAFRAFRFLFFPRERGVNREPGAVKADAS